MQQAPQHDTSKTYSHKNKLIVWQPQYYFDVVQLQAKCASSYNKNVWGLFEMYQYDRFDQWNWWKSENLQS